MCLSTHDTAFRASHTDSFMMKMRTSSAGITPSVRVRHWPLTAGHPDHWHTDHTDHWLLTLYSSFNNKYLSLVDWMLSSPRWRWFSFWCAVYMSCWWLLQFSQKCESYMWRDETSTMAVYSAERGGSEYWCHNWWVNCSSSSSSSSCCCCCSDTLVDWSTNSPVIDRPITLCVFLLARSSL